MAGELTPLNHPARDRSNLVATVCESCGVHVKVDPKESDRDCPLCGELGSLVRDRIGGEG